MAKAASMDKINITEPDYWPAFVCSGGDCPDTCCQGWDIVIDPATCARYEKSGSREFRKLLSRAVVHRREDGAAGPSEVACIRMGRGQRCLFLRNDGLCMIQRQTEEKNLSQTCRTYPRVIHRWQDGAADRALCVSCPAAARLILQHQGHLQFHQQEIPAAELAGLRVEAQGGRLAEANQPLRQRLIRILQDDRLPVRRRLRLANDFFWQAAALGQRHWQRPFAALAAAGRQRREQAVRRQAPLAREPAGWLAEAEGLLRLRLKNPALAPLFRQRLQAALAGWPLTEEGRHQFREARALYDMFLLPEVTGMWENYLVNGVFKNVFLREDSAECCCSWCQLVLQFVLARFLLLAAFAAGPDDFGPEDMLELLQQLTRAVGHDPRYLEQALDWEFRQGDGENALQDFCAKMI